MNKKRVASLLLIYLLVIACRLSGGAESGLTPPSATFELSFTLTPHLATWTPEPTAWPVVEPEPTATRLAQPADTPAPSPTAAPPGWQAGPLINYQGIQFRLDPALGDGVFIHMTDFAAGVEFSHSRVTNFCHQQPFCIGVYDAQAFGQDSFAGWTIEWVAQLIAGDHEGLPTRGAAFLIETQTRRIRFQNGAGVRAVTMVGQMEYLAYKDAVYYEFHGLSGDGRFYVVIDIQIDHPLFLDHPQPEQNQRRTALLPREPMSPTDPAAIVSYNRLLEMELEEQPPDSFMPSLLLLDQLVASLLAQLEASPPGDE
jgi:hypothetical protein